MISDSWVLVYIDQHLKTWPLNSVDPFSYLLTTVDSSCRMLCSILVVSLSRSASRELFDIFLTLIITGWSYCSDVCCCRWKKWDGEVVSTPTQSHSWWKRPSTFEHFYKNEIEIQWKARKKWIKILKGQVCIFPMLFCLWYHNVLVSSELCKCF